MITNILNVHHFSKSAELSRVEFKRRGHNLGVIICVFSEFYVNLQSVWYVRL